jgi:prolyl 4-hydroxylase
MVYLEANVTGGGTHFPPLDTRLNSEDRYEIIDCSGDRNGTTFRPIAGNALFWMNVRGDGRRHPATIHAGLPVETGAKTIWNIWLWQDGSKIPVWLN